MERDDDVIDRPAARDRRGRVRRYVGVVAGAVALLILGAAGGVLWSERHGGMRARPAAPNRDAQTPAASPGGRSMPGMSSMSAPTGQAGAAKTEEAVEVSLTPEAVERAGIKIAEAKAQSSVSGVTVPGTVTANAYRDTKVNALVGGIVRQVMVELGADVRRGAPLAVIFSSELAEAQTKYLSMRAMLEADHQKLERTQKLVAIGAASRQEMEEVTAVHAGHETEVAAARQRLLLLGLTQQQVADLKDPKQVVSQIGVPAPIGGVITARSANPGQVVAMGQELFVVTDLGTVWLVGDLYEQDFSSVRVGSEATVTAAAY